MCNMFLLHDMSLLKKEKRKLENIPSFSGFTRQAVLTDIDGGILT